MGDCGNYNADVSVRFSLKKAEKNTEQECLDFLSVRKVKYLSVFDFDEDLDELQKLITDNYEQGIVLEYRDWDEWNSSESSLEDMIDGSEERNEPQFYALTSKRDATVSDLEYVNLDLLKEYKINNVDSSLTHSICILSIGDSIYCDNDNSSSDSCDVSEFAKIMQLPSAELVLFGDGNGNC